MEFNLPKNSSSIIKVIGVGGGGSNAVNHMYEQGIQGVDFMVCNTDQQALDASPVEHKVQLGISLTEGMGAGSIPERGRNAAIETIEEIREVLSSNTKMVFITAGMGGGTGTGAAPVIAEVAREMEILTVGIVTMPFFFEGRKRRQQAEQGINEIRDHVDTLLVINNDKLREMYGNLKMREAFAQADNVLTTAAKGIAEIITRTGHVNVDFEDVRTVMNSSGAAIMGSAIADGDNRAIKAVENALASPLLNDNDIKGARYVLLNMEFGSEEITMDEISDITDYIQEEAGSTADIIWGYGEDSSLDEGLRVTIIATGFESQPVDQQHAHQAAKPSGKVVKTLEDDVNTNLTKPIQHQQKPTSFKAEAPKNEEPYLKQEEEEAPQQPQQSQSQSVIEFDLRPKRPAVEEQHNKMEEQEDQFEPYLKPKETQIETSHKVTPEPAQTSAPAPVAQSQPEMRQQESNKQQQEEDNFSMEEQRRRAQERMKKLNDLSNRLRTPSGINDLENEPAYKRRQIQLNDTPHSSDSQISRYTLSEETNEDGERKTGLRPNNSFLHDNVD